MLHNTQKTQKITACLPTMLLHDAQAFTGLGITETIKQGLSQLVMANAYEKIRQFRGKVNMSINLTELREDRDKS